ncbi:MULTISPECIES: thiol peroxidase [Gemella]|uniref:thiol peroxidase n=1 Tax=Gemella TaxID=1378 RepID=UPI0007683DCD|nr:MULTISPECIES: thiol peroxidase [Gemella]AME10153.1 lipid hydroperoxide peroxidase [Gemella sp. oral taxon 928]AXI27441.1 lipid hydroperoxide peroxidase [Gemella sp. ND 6198]
MKKTISFKGKPVTVVDIVKVGDVFPTFKAVTKELADFNLEDYKGKVVVINAFPSVDTGICALQTIRFNKEVKNYNDLVVITVSKDLPFALGRFCADKGIENAITVSDYKYKDFENNAGGLIEELGLLARLVYVLDREGVVRHKELCEEVGSEPNYEAALEVVKKIL